jgi:hypothetical protein
MRAEFVSKHQYLPASLQLRCLESNWNTSANILYANWIAPAIKTANKIVKTNSVLLECVAAAGPETLIWIDSNSQQ